MPTLLDAMTANWYKQEYNGEQVYVNQSSDLYITEKDLKSGNGNLRPFQKPATSNNTSSSKHLS